MGELSESVRAKVRGQLAGLREQILACDQELVKALRRRADLVERIARAKRVLGLPVLDPEREAAVARRAARFARHYGLDEELVRTLIWRVMESARNQQHGEEDEAPD